MNLDLLGHFRNALHAAMEPVTDVYLLPAADGRPLGSKGNQEGACWPKIRRRSSDCSENNGAQDEEDLGKATL